MNFLKKYKIHIFNFFLVTFSVADTLLLYVSDLSSIVTIHLEPPRNKKHKLVSVISVYYTYFALIGTHLETSSPVKKNNYPHLFSPQRNDT
jgi:hypothetical protein